MGFEAALGATLGATLEVALGVTGAGVLALASGFAATLVTA